MDPWLAALLAYALGCVSFASLAARLKGVDIRKVGSGNPGATNVGRALGNGWGRAVLLADLAKGLVPPLVWTGPALAGDPEGATVLVAAAVLGHVYPVTMGFRGGKGVATLVGGFLALDWAMALVAVAIHYGVRARVGYVSVASVALAWAFPAARLAVHAAGEGTPVSEDAGLLVLGGLAVVVTLRHVGNFARIRAGTEDRYDDPPPEAPASTTREDN